MNPGGGRVMMLTTLAAIVLCASESRGDRENVKAPERPPPEPPQPSLPGIQSASEGEVALARPNIAAEFARHQAISRDRERMQSAKAKQARKAAKRLRDAASRAR